MDIKKIEKLSSMPLDKIAGTNEWYFSAEWTGDVYEAEEMIREGEEFEGTTMYLIHYPDGEVFFPFEKKKNIYIQRPVWDNDAIAVLTVNFDCQEISIFRFLTSDYSLKCIASVPLSSVTDCYNLHLMMSPLTLYRQGADGKFEIIWPEQVSFMIDDTESLVHRDGNFLYFSKWYENPDYKEEINVRNAHTGKLVNNFTGILYDMPDGSWWLL